MCRMSGLRFLQTVHDHSVAGLEASGDVITINDLKTGHYLDVNQVFCDVMGYTRKEVLGRSALELGVWVHPDEVRNLLHLLKNRFQGSTIADDPLERTLGVIGPRVHDCCIIFHRNLYT